LSVHHNPITLWRISDGKAGHDAQSQGLAAALARIVNCQIYEVVLAPQTGFCTGLFGVTLDPAHKLPDPDFLIGAGHRTHLPMLRTRHQRGGHIILMMKPSLPTACFDLCFIPEHDKPSNRPNIRTTRGAINTIVPSDVRDPHKGLILIGGPSRHYRWDEDRLMHQLQRIVEGSALRWEITDSPRTPDSTRQRLAGCINDRMVYIPCHQTPRGWVGAHLQGCNQVWVTEDSVSMLYEALSSGSTVGLLDVPARKATDRIAMAVRQLAEEGLVTPYDEWVKLGSLKPLAAPLNEADRCARIVAETYSLPLQYSPR
jgi:uncharacterized protein